MRRWWWVVLSVGLVAAVVVVWMLLRDSGPGDDRIVAISADGVVVFDTAGEELARYEVTTPMGVVAYADADHVIVSGEDDDYVRVALDDGAQTPWPVTSGSMLRPLVGTSLLVVGSPSGESTLEVRDTTTNLAVQLSGESENSFLVPDAVFANPSGTTVAVSDFGGGIEQVMVAVLAEEQAEQYQVPGRLIGLTDDRLVTLEWDSPEESTVVFYELDGTEIVRHDLSGRYLGAAVTGRGVLLQDDQALWFLAEDDELARVDDADENQGLMPVSQHTERALLVDSDSDLVWLLDGAGERLAEFDGSDLRVLAPRDLTTECLLLGAGDGPVLAIDAEDGTLLADNLGRPTIARGSECGLAFAAEAEGEGFEATSLGHERVVPLDDEWGLRAVSGTGSHIVVLDDGGLELFDMTSDDPPVALAGLEGDDRLYSVVFVPGS